MKTLFIKTTPKKDADSYTMKVANAFLDAYKKSNPSHEVVFLDLYQENIENLDREKTEKIFSGSDTIMAKYARQFAEADKYIIAAPMWNFSFPAVMKSYIDYISIPGITFNFTEKGPIGLLSGKGKKAIHITARGGVYSSGPAAEFEMGDRYLRTIFKFFGIDNIETLALEGTNYFVGPELEVKVEEALKNAERIAKKF